MTVDFTDYFWGDKNNGFDVLYHNMKYGLVASKELADYFRERSAIEENNSKLLAKLAKQAGSNCVHGTFAPLWQVLKSSSEKLSTLHFQMFQKMQELVKEVNKYTDELHKKHKVVKEEESSTLEAVQVIQSTTATLQKAKDAYVLKGIELDKLKKENGSPRDLDKAEAKFKKAHEDYKNLVEKYSNIREEFERKMSVACKHFQEVEEAHLKQMKEFLNTYAEILEANHEQIGQVHADLRRQCVEMTMEKLLEQFVLSKYTGLEKPGSIEFEELNVSNLSASNSQTLDSSDKAANGEKPSKKEGFLKSRREKKKEKKTKSKKKDVDNTSNKEERSDVEEKEDSRKSETETPTPDVDEEGYSIKPQIESWENDKGSFYSSSDSDSDDEQERKIHVNIKPLNNGSAPISASVDELRATVGNLSLSPVALVSGRRGSSGESDTMIKRSQSQQFGGPPVSSALTPTGSMLHTSLQIPSVQSVSNATMSQVESCPPTSRYADLGDLFSEVGEIHPVLPPKQSRQTTPTPNAVAIPRPSSRKSDGASPRGRISPSSLSRADSVGSLEFSTSGMPLGSSRGPSPLTIGMADTIPLAVAFHEIIHSYFRGTDETKCQVRISGDMMVSFPAGIVAVLANNPTPAQLTFRIRGCCRLENVHPNKQLINLDSSQRNSDNLVFEFHMSALTALLRKQAEQNPSASYFNVDILKYQVKPKTGAQSCPLQLVAYWKCEELQTDLKIDYKYNSHAMGSASSLLNVTVAVPVDGGVKSMQSKPTGQWVQESCRAVWKFTELSQHSDNHGVGSLRARFEVSCGPSNQATIAAQFNCEGTTLSNAEFELVGMGYRLSLVKRRFVSGKYVCDGDPDKFRYSSPPCSRSIEC